MALRGRFLVGSRPLSDDLVRRFILCAAESGIEIFRLHDPLNDVENLASAAAAVREAGGRLYAGLAFSGYMPNLPRVRRQGAHGWPSWAPITCCCTIPPARSIPAPATRS